MIIVNNNRQKNSDGKIVMAVYCAFALHAIDKLRMKPAVIESSSHPIIGGQVNAKR